jgi:hypothetical protein
LKSHYHFAKEKIKEYMINNWAMMEKDFDFNAIGKRMP